MTRRLKDGILKSICSYVENTEIPDIFALWSGVACISACMGRDCFIDQGHFTVYPNMYVVLVAGSAKCRKSTSINLAGDLLEKVQPDIRMLSQKMTPEALIGALSGNDVKDETTVIQEAEGIAIVDELSTLIDNKAFTNGMISVLTKLYDCKDFEYQTRARGVELVKNPCLSIFGGSTLHWIKECVPLVSIGGGFTSRVVFVYRDVVDKLVPWPQKTPDQDRILDGMVSDLCAISKLRGPFGFNEDAKKIYSEEYKRFIRNSDMFESKNLSGYAGRRHVMILKLSMIISASESDDRVVDKDDVRVAINIIENVETHMPKVLAAISSEAVGDVCEEVLLIIMRRRIITRPQLIKEIRHKLSSRELDIVLETLLEMRAVDSVAEDNQIKYVYKG